MSLGWALIEKIGVLIKKKKKETWASRPTQRRVPCEDTDTEKRWPWEDRDKNLSDV